MPNVTLERRLRRAAAYLRKLGPAVQGQAGDEQTFRACKVGKGMGLSEPEFWPVLAEWNSSCSPPWDDRELERKLRSTYRNTVVQFGELLGDGYEDRPRPSVPPPIYPPKREVQWLWQTCLPVGVHGSSSVLDCPAAAWLRSMNLDPARLGLHPELQVRAMPDPIEAVWKDGVRIDVPRKEWPAWALTRHGRWCDSGYGAVVPLFDERGELRSMKARWTVLGKLNEETGEMEGGAPPDGMKSVPPTGFDVRGLVMANVQALYLLMHGAWEPSTPRDERELWLVEGEPDFEVASYRLHNSPRPRRACMGIFSGAWTPAIASRVPKDSTVVNAQDPDRGGDKLAEHVQKTLQGRAQIRRFDARKLHR